MTILALAVPFVGTVLAHQPGVSTSAHDLEIAPETDTNPTGTTHTLTAFVTDSPGVPSGAGHVVDFEIESGPAATVNCTPAGGTNPCTSGTSSDDGNTPLSPDMTCTTTADGICQVFFTSQTQGVHVIRGWVDDDTSDATGPAQGDGDPTETRFSGGNDCATQTQPAGNPYGTDAGTAQQDGQTCNTGGTPPNTVAEPDDTDVVTKTWQGTFPQGCIDAEPEAKNNARNTTHTITAMATSGQLRPQGTGTPPARPDNPDTFDCEGAALGGATVTFNIPDDSPNIYVKSVNGVATGGPVAGDGPDSATCTTPANGTCTFEIELVNQNDALSTPAASTNEDMIVRLENTGGTNTQTFDEVDKTWFIQGTVGEVNGTPEIDTNVIGETHTITCRIEDAGDNPIANQTCAARITGGSAGNQNRDVDNNIATTPGYIGSCETSASGTCTMTYTSTVAGRDEITVFNDPDRSQTVTGNEAASQDVIFKDWVAVGQGPSRVAADVEPLGSSGTGGALGDERCNEPLDADDGERNTTGNVTETSELFCARVFAANGTVETPTQVTWTITGGPGNFTNRAGTANRGSSFVSEADECNSGTTPSSGTGGGGGTYGAGNYNCVFIESQLAGTTTVTGCITGTTNCVTVTKRWFGAEARSLSCTPATATNRPGTLHNVTCVAVDVNGNPQQGAFVQATETGTGRFTGPNAQNAQAFCSTGFGACGSTDAEGEIVFTTTTNSGEEGTQTITATLAAFHQNDNTVQECERAANDPAGSVAGNCDVTVSKTWDEDAPGDDEFPEQEFGGDVGQDVNSGPCAGFTTGSVQNAAGGGLVIVGTNGADALQGSEDGDLICGLGGADTINGAGGGDTIYGNGGKDAINGGDGNDTLFGNNGKDVIIAGAGNDNVRGGRHNDNLSGGGGNDTVLGQGGWDTLKGNSGDDLLDGAGGNDILQGGGGNDVARGGGGDDVLKGFSGRDRLIGAGGNDIIRGSAGNDTLRGGKGDDVLNGGGGTDRCRPGPGSDVVRRCER